MADERCIHDLLPGQCALCLGHDREPAPRPIAHTFTARYDGACAVSASHPITAGDLVGFTVDDELVCGRCVQAAS